MTTCGTGGWTGPLPGDPDNNISLSATSILGGIRVSWTYPVTNANAVAHTLLFRGSNNVFSNALQIAVVAGNNYVDPLRVTVNTTYYYWIKLVSINGTVNATIGPASGVAVPLGNDIIESLSGLIDAGALATALRADIANIIPTREAILKEITDRVTSNLLLSQEVRNVQTGIATNYTFLNQETLQRRTDNSALVSSVNTLSVGTASKIGLIQESLLTKLDDDGVTSIVSEYVSANVLSDLEIAELAASTATALDQAAKDELAAIASDTWLTSGEKPWLVRQVKLLNDEQAGIVTQANRYALYIDTNTPADTTLQAAVRAAITVPLANYNAGIASMNSYLATLKVGTTVQWNVVPGVNVPVNPTTFNNTFDTVYLKKQTLLDAIVAAAKLLVDKGYAVASGAHASLNDYKIARATTDSTLALRLTGMDTSIGNAVAGVLGVEKTQIGYSAFGEAPYDGDGSFVVYPTYLYSTADYPHYAANRTRIIDKVGVSKWNEASIHNSKQLTWVVGMPLASAMKAVQVTDVNGNTATVEQTLQAIQTSSGSLSSSYVLKTDVKGLTGGFGIYNNGVEVDVGFNASRFWVGSSAVGAIKPFIIDGGTTYINSAHIKDGTITNAKIGDVIQSANYVAGSTGWQIKKTGAAEFNGDVTINGKLTTASLQNALISNVASYSFTLTRANPIFSYTHNKGRPLLVTLINTRYIIYGVESGSSIPYGNVEILTNTTTTITIGFPITPEVNGTQSLTVTAVYI